MKKTLAVLLAMLMMLSLAPSVFAARNDSAVKMAVLDDENDGDTTEPGEGEGEDEDVQHFVEVDDLGKGGYFMITGFNSAYTQVAAMNNQRATANNGAYEGLGFTKYPAEKDENGRLFVDNPSNNNVWYVDYDENDGYIIQNVGNNKYLYLAGFDPVTTSDEITSWDWAIDDTPTYGKGIPVLRLHNVTDANKDNCVLSWTGSYYGIFKSGMAAFGAQHTFTLLKLESDDEPIESYDPPTPVGPGGDEYKLVEYGREFALRDGVSYVFAINNMALTNKEATAGTLVGAPIEPVNGVLTQPDAQMCWDVVIASEETGDFMLRNAATGQYLAGGRFSPNGVAAAMYLSDEEYAVTNNGAQWSFEFQGLDMSGEEDVYNYSMRCTLLTAPGANRYIAFDGAKFKMDDDFMGITVYQIVGETPKRPWDNDEPVEPTTPPVTEDPTEDPTDEPEPSTDPDTIYTVTFVDWDGTELSKVNVRKGEAAEAPEENPTRTNWAFLGWDKDFKEVYEDMTVTAQYAKLGDVNRDGNVNAGDATLILRQVAGIGTPLTEEQMLIANVNQNEKVDAGDATMVLRHAVGANVIDYGPEAPAEDKVEDNENEENDENGENGEDEGTEDDTPSE